MRESWAQLGAANGPCDEMCNHIILVLWYSYHGTLHIKMVLTGTLLIFEFILVLSRCDQMCNYIMLLYSY